MWFYQTVMRPKRAVGMANRVDSDQSAALDLGMVCCSDLSVPERTLTVIV